jgi:hypothetical protein
LQTFKQAPKQFRAIGLGPIRQVRQDGQKAAGPTGKLPSTADEGMPFSDCVELARKSGLSESALVVIGHEPRLVQPAD